MKQAQIMGNVKMNIEVRIEADDESAARHYAATHGIDVSNAKWASNGVGKNGRLYTASTTHFGTV